MNKTASGSFPKKEVLNRWGDLSPQKINPEPVMYKHKGTTIDQDGIRITGGLEFIESVLSRLTDLLAFENGSTRLQVAFSELTDKETGLKMEGRYRCSIQVHERGQEAQMVNAIIGSRTGKQMDFTGQFK